MVECQICLETKMSYTTCPLKNCGKYICKDCKTKLTGIICPFCQRKLPQPWYNTFKFCKINTDFENILHLHSYIILLLPTILITLLSFVQIINCLLNDVR